MPDRRRAHRLLLFGHTDYPGAEHDMRCLTVFARHEDLAGLTITEFNPDHGAEDGSTTDTLVRALVGALAG